MKCEALASAGIPYTVYASPLIRAKWSTSSWPSTGSIETSEETYCSGTRARQIICGDAGSVERHEAGILGRLQEVLVDGQGAGPHREAAAALLEERLGHRDHVGAGNVVVDAPDAVAERHEVGRAGEEQHAVALDDLVRRLPARVLARELGEIEMAERGFVESRHDRRR